MSQTAALRTLDARLMRAFSARGFADTVTYTPPVGAPVAGIKVYVDRAAAFLDQDGVAIAGNRIVIGILRADVNAPLRAGTLTIGAETFTLEELLQQDESLTRWVVLP
jgi:hypothetical protein